VLEPRSMAARPRRFVRYWLAAIVVGAACVPLTALAFRLRSDPQPSSLADPAAPSTYRLEVAPAGVDDSGAVLLRVQLVRAQAH
jgi:hypothetical protein